VPIGEAAATKRPTLEKTPGKRGFLNPCSGCDKLCDNLTRFAGLTAKPPRQIAPNLDFDARQCVETNGGKNMKKLILSAAAAMLFASPMAIATASAAPQHRTVTKTVRTGPAGRQVVTKRVVRPAPRPAYRRWAKGQRFDSRYAQNYRVVNNWQQYRGRRLYAPPRGYHWVRSGNDAVLVAVAGGVIGAVLAGAFN